MNETKKTLETQAPSNTAAISTPATIDYLAIVKVNAKRKVDNGAQFSSVKGKISLLLCVCDQVGSELTIEKKDNGNGKFTRTLPDDVFAKCKEATETFWRNQAVQIANNAIENDAKVTTRYGILMTRIGKNDALLRTKTDKMISVYSPQTEQEFKLCDTFGLTAANARMDWMLDNVGKYSREELKAQQHVVELLQNAVASHK